MSHRFLCSDNDLIVVVLLLVLLLRVLALVVLKSRDEGLFAVVVHLDELGVRLEGRDRN